MMKDSLKQLKRILIQNLIYNNKTDSCVEWNVENGSVTVEGVGQ